MLGMYGKVIHVYGYVFYAVDEYSYYFDTRCGISGKSLT